MNSVPTPDPSSFRQFLSTVALLIAAAGLAIMFSLFVATTTLAAPPPQCTFCHKRTMTMTLPCASLEHRRHLDHGDTQGACPPTMTAGEGRKLDVIDKSPPVIIGGD